MNEKELCHRCVGFTLMRLIDHKFFCKTKGKMVAISTCKKFTPNDPDTIREIENYLGIPQKKYSEVSAFATIPKGHIPIPDPAPSLWAICWRLGLFITTGIFILLVLWRL